MDAAEQRIPLPRGFNVRRTLGRIRFGPRDPTAQRLRNGIVFALRTPAGPATMVITQADDGHADVRAFGPGAVDAVAGAPDLCGAADTTRADAEALIASNTHPVVAAVTDAHRTIFYIRQRGVMRTLLPIVLEQRVTAREAHAAYAALCHIVAEPAPGPFARLLLPPDPDRVKRLTMDEWFSLGVLRQQARTMSELARRSRTLEKKGAESDAALRAYFEVFPGVGPWTINSFFKQARADPDAFEIGDYHLKNGVVHAFTGRARGDDDEMVALLAPFAPQRGRVVRWLGAKGKLRAPRFGPKAPFRQAPNATRRGRL